MMLEFLRKRVTIANVGIVFAVIFAMAGGAYAAGKYVITSTKQISPKVLKSLQGKQGPAGPHGVQGLAGPTGPAGANGKDGTAGVNGSNGTNGESVSAKTVATTDKTKCGGLGGVEYTLAGKATLICNGQTGFTSTLPSGKSETGEWVTNGAATADPELGGEAAVETPISFPIPLETAPAEVHFVNPSEQVKGCAGTVAKPEAEPGNLCIFVFKTTSGFLLTVSGGTGALFKADATGAILYDAITKAGEQVFAKGTWAVTAK